MSRSLLSSFGASFALAGGSGVGIAHLIKAEGGTDVGVVRKAASATCVGVTGMAMAFLSAKTVLARVSHQVPTQ